MNKKELITLIKELGKLDSPEKQMEILSELKEKKKISEVNFRLAKNIIAMYNAQVIFKIKYTQDQFKFAYSLIQ